MISITSIHNMKKDCYFHMKPRNNPYPPIIVQVKEIRLEERGDILIEVLERKELVNISQNTLDNFFISEIDMDNDPEYFL